MPSWCADSRAIATHTRSPAARSEARWASIATPASASSVATSSAKTRRSGARSGGAPTWIVPTARSIRGGVSRSSSCHEARELGRIRGHRAREIGGVGRDAAGVGDDEGDALVADLGGEAQQRLGRRGLSRIGEPGEDVGVQRRGAARVGRQVVRHQVRRAERQRGRRGRQHPHRRRPPQPGAALRLSVRRPQGGPSPGTARAPAAPAPSRPAAGRPRAARSPSAGGRARSR